MTVNKELPVWLLKEVLNKLPDDYYLYCNQVRNLSVLKKLPEDDEFEFETVGFIDFVWKDEWADDEEVKNEVLNIYSEQEKDNE